jgi:hypothetical protein
MYRFQGDRDRVCKWFMNFRTRLERTEADRDRLRGTLEYVAEHADRANPRNFNEAEDVMVALRDAARDAIGAAEKEAIHEQRNVV